MAEKWISEEEEEVELFGPFYYDEIAKEVNETGMPDVLARVIGEYACWCEDCREVIGELRGGCDAGNPHCKMQCPCGPCEQGLELEECECCEEMNLFSIECSREDKDKEREERLIELHDRRTREGTYRKPKILSRKETEEKKMRDKLKYEERMKELCGAFRMEYRTGMI